MENKLSLMSGFDDLMRVYPHLIDQQLYDVLIEVLEKFENLRVLYVKSLEESKNKDLTMQNLDKKLLRAEEAIKNYRYKLDNQIKENEKINAHFNDMKSKLSKIRILTNEENVSKDEATVYNKLLSFIGDFNYDPIQDHDPKNSSGDRLNDDSDESIVFDKSGDDLDDLPRVPESKIRKINSTSSFGQPFQSGPSFSSQHFPSKVPLAHLSEIEEAEESDSVLNTGFISDDGMKSFNHQPSSSELKPSHAPMVESSNMAKTPTLTRLNSQSSYVLSNNFKMSVSKMEPERLNDKMHIFTKKKAVKPCKCHACAKSISFFSVYSVCQVCEKTVHEKCQENLPRPCLRLTDSPGVKKMISLSNATTKSTYRDHFIKITDFIPDDVRPCVPGLLIMCCKEIERRVYLAAANPQVISHGASNSIVNGVYKKSTSEQNVRKLRLKILEKEVAVLSDPSIDVHTICNVVKSFLRDLDDPVVTRVLWNDFARAAANVDLVAKSSHIDGFATDSDYGSNVSSQADMSCVSDFQKSLLLLQNVIIQLPHANRDSLAFLMVHFHKIISNKIATNMTVQSLCSNLAPSVVGSSSSGRLSIGSRNKETEVQTRVMQSFFRIPLKYWTEMLNNPNFLHEQREVRSRTRRLSLSSSICSNGSKGQQLNRYYTECKITDGGMKRVKRNQLDLSSIY